MLNLAWRATLRPMKPLSRRMRRIVLTLHITGGVGLLGVCAVIVFADVRALTMDDPQPVYELMVSTPLLGIPLSFLSLATGILLGLTSKWGVLRYGWVTTKLVLNVSVILVGALVLGPQTAAMADDGSGSEIALVVGSAYDVVALLLATGLSVFKPRAAGRRGARARARTAATSDPPADPSRSRILRPTRRAT
jgi:hypothetical protein